MIWKAEGLSEYDGRRPLTRTGTNLLGLIKHLSIGEAWCFGQVFDRPFEPHLPWWDDDAQEGADMWVTASESGEDTLETYRPAIAHADETIRSPDLDAPGHVPGGSDPTSPCTGCWCTPGRTARHAGRDASRQPEPGAARRRVVGRLPVTDRSRRALSCFEVSDLQYRGAT